MRKKGSDLSKSARQELLIGILRAYATGEGIATRVIFDLLNSRGIHVNIRTIYRDLLELSRFPSLSETGSENDKRWFWDKSFERQANLGFLQEEYLKEIMRFIKPGAS